MGRRRRTLFLPRFSPPLSFELICISCPTADLPILAAIVARELVLGAIRFAAGVLLVLAALPFHEIARG